jgi:hypothetical protein
VAGERVAYLFRDTAVGFMGSVYPRLGWTSMTVDPVVAVVFALTGYHLGEPVVYVAPLTKLTRALDDRRGRTEIADLEEEFVVAMSPAEVAALSYAVAADQAKSALEQLGVRFPPNMYNLADQNAALRLTKRLRSDEIELFVRAVGVGS